MRHRRAESPGAIAGVALALLFALPSSANARKLQMSGTWAIRTGQIFIPLQFAERLPYGTITSMGDLSKALGYPNDAAIPGGGVVTATGSAPATLLIPQHRFQTQASVLLPFKGVTLVQITTMLAIDGPFEPAVLAPGGGPGTFTWCPNDVLGCPATGRPNGGDRHGRVIYRAGANQFGGAMRIGLAGRSVVSALFDASPFQVFHAYSTATGETPRVFAVGAGAPHSTGMGRVYLPPGIVTQPTMAATPSGPVLYPGPKLTTMLGLTTTAAGPIFHLPALGVTSGGMAFARATSSYGFGHTTGTVIVQETHGSYIRDFFTVMGSDMRTALGAGNISTVAGGIAFSNTLAGQNPYATFHKVWFSLAPPVPSLSPAGVAAAGALLLLAVGYALRRRAGS